MSHSKRSAGKKDKKKKKKKKRVKMGVFFRSNVWDER